MLAWDSPRISLGSESYPCHPLCVTLGKARYIRFWGSIAQEGLDYFPSTSKLPWFYFAEAPLCSSIETYNMLYVHQLQIPNLPDQDVTRAYFVQCATKLVLITCMHPFFPYQYLLKIPLLYFSVKQVPLYCLCFLSMGAVTSAFCLVLSICS